MNLIPTWPIAASCLAMGLLAGAGGMRAWDADTISDLELEIERIKTKQAVNVATESQAALKRLQNATLVIETAAKSSVTDITALGTKLDAIDRRYRNAKPPTILAPDCKPGAERVRRLTEGAAAVNDSIARPATSP